MFTQCIFLLFKSFIDPFATYSFGVLCSLMSKYNSEYYHIKLPLPSDVQGGMVAKPSQRLSTESKTVSKYCNMSKTRGGPSTPLYHGGYMTLRVRPRGKLMFQVMIFFFS